MPRRDSAITYVIDTRCATPRFPGIGRYAANLVQALAPLLEPHEHLYLLFASKTISKWRDSLPLSSNIRVIDSDASPFSVRQQWTIPKLLRMLKDEQEMRGFARPILYHSLYYLMPYRPRVPTILTFYDAIPLRFPAQVSLQARLFFRFTMSLALRASAHVVAISLSARDDLLAYFEIAPHQVTTVPLAPDPRFKRQSSSEVERVRARYALPQEFLLYFGINKPHKNLARLLQAYAGLESPTLPLIIAGAWDERYPEAKQEAAKLALSGHVHFLGPISEQDLPALYASATAFVFPSVYEGFGLPVLEAMACGTPVACSNTSSLPEAAGDAALYFDPQNVTEMIAVLQRLLTDAGLRADLRTRGLHRAARFSWRHTAEATLAIYRQIVDSSSKYLRH
jgi:alpha-1,3-rhamnosyl/mannosyltransferase